MCVASGMYKVYPIFQGTFHMKSGLRGGPSCERKKRVWHMNAAWNLNMCCSWDDGLGRGQTTQGFIPGFL